MIKRLYSKEDVSKMTLQQIEDLIEKEGITYAGDYGFEVQKSVNLVYSEN